jgi:hypothetical protein
MRLDLLDPFLGIEVIPRLEAYRASRPSGAGR